MKIEWEHVSEDKSVAKTGAWVLTARDMRRGWVGCIEHPCLVESQRVASREEAQAEAEALVGGLVAPFVEAEREACAKIADAAGAATTGYTKSSAMFIGQRIRQRGSK